MFEAQRALSDPDAYTDGLWRHKKSGALYKLITAGVLEKDRSTVMVVYDSAHDSDLERERWVRPASEFVERFEPAPNGTTPPLTDKDSAS